MAFHTETGGEFYRSSCCSSQHPGQASQPGVCFFAGYEKESEICVVLDIPDGNQKEIAEFFSYRINQSPQENLNFSFYYRRSHARVIVTGSPGPVMALMDAYYARQSKE